MVENRFILEFLSSFLSLPILDKDGKRKNPDSRRMGIPPVGMISNVLLNLVLVNFDREFRSMFPYLPYFRYLDEAFVAFTLTSNEVEEIDDVEELIQEMDTFLLELRLDGKVDLLSAGDMPVPSFGGFVFLNDDGIITFIESLDMMV